MWALGIVLFQLLHEGRTPFQMYFGQGNIATALAIADENVHKTVTVLGRKAFVQHAVLCTKTCTKR